MVNLIELLSLIDLTSLNETDDAAAIATLCQQAVTAQGHVAAVCVYPAFVVQAKQLLRDTPVKIATVLNFPHGTDSLENILPAIQQTIAEGADEIDVVFPYPAYLRGETTVATDMVYACKLACGDKILKVILETGMLPDLAMVERVSMAACEGGADFIKTSTGKVAVGATLEAVKVMLQVIHGRKVGVKVSGGIRTIEDATRYVELAQGMMGKEWVTPARFRIGASKLVQEIYNKIG